MYSLGQAWMFHSEWEEKMISRKISSGVWAARAGELLPDLLKILARSERDCEVWCAPSQGELPRARSLSFSASSC
jgi:hypothetical protein